MSHQCGLCQFSHSPNLNGIGPKPSRVMIVGDNPNWQEDKDGVYGRGNTHEMLVELCEKNGIAFDDVYYTPAVKCRKNDKGKVPVGDLKIHKETLHEEIKQVQPDYVITLGSTALKAVTNKAKITEVHGSEIEHKLGFIVLPTFHPSMSLRDPRYYDRIHTDFVKFGKIINGIKRREHKLKFQGITKLQQLNVLLKELEKLPIISFDLETNGLEMRLPTSEITMTVIGGYDTVWVIDHSKFKRSTLERYHKKICRITDGKIIVGQNAKFDNLWLHYQFGCRMNLTFDTMLASHLIDENSPNALKYQARAQLEMDDWDIDLATKKGSKEPEHKEPPTSAYKLALKRVQNRVKGKVVSSKAVIKLKEAWINYRESQKRLLEYAAWDGYATIRLYDVFSQGLKDQDGLEKLFYKLVMPVARTYEDLEITGTFIDTAKMDEAGVILDKKLRRIKRSMMRHLGPWRENDLESINLNSSNDLNKVMFDWLGLKPVAYTDGGAPSTAEDNLIKMKDQHPFVSLLLEYRGAFKQKSSFIDGWRQRMINGQIFPGFKVAGTVTGRPSCSNPNLQQVPRDPFIRSLIGAPPGYVFFEVDYSQVELRVAAAISGEPTMLQIFRTGGDIHEATYKMLMGCTPEEKVEALIKKGDIQPEQAKAQIKEERKKAKAVNFGFIYGMGWKTFREYAELKYGLVLTEKEAKAWRVRYFDQYPGLIKWHERQRRVAHATAGVRTFTGRIRHLPQINSPDKGLVSEAERNAINAPVQGFGAEMILMALVESHAYFKNNPEILRFNGTIHDAMVGIVREDVALECMKRVKMIMESPHLLEVFGIELPLPIIADVSLGNWGIAKEYSEDEMRDIIPIELSEAA